MPTLESKTDKTDSVHFYPYMSSPPLHTTGELVMSEAPTRKNCFPSEGLWAETMGVVPDLLALA